VKRHQSRAIQPRTPALPGSWTEPTDVTGAEQRPRRWPPSPTTPAPTPSGAVTSREHRSWLPALRGRRTIQQLGPPPASGITRTAEILPVDPVDPVDPLEFDAPVTLEILWVRTGQPHRRRRVDEVTVREAIGVVLVDTSW
jgi:hypothetical protein